MVDSPPYRRRFGTCILARFVQLSVLLVAFACLSVPPAPAAAEHLSSFDTEMRIRRDGTVWVREHIVYQFDGAWRRGTERDLPRQTELGAPLQIDVLGVQDSNGRAIVHRVEPGVGFTRVYVGDQESAITGEFAYSVTYVMHGALAADRGAETFTWSAPGFDLMVPTEAASLSIRPPTATQNGRCAVGPASATAWTEDAATDRCEAYSESGVWRFSAVNLAPGEALNVQLELPAGSIRPRSVIAVVASRVGGYLPLWLLAPLFLFAVLHLGRARLRPPRRGKLDPYVAVPPLLSPAEIGVVWDEDVDLDDVVATVLNLGARGHLRVQEQTSSRRLFFARRNFTLTRLRNSPDAPTAYETLLLDTLFEMSDVVSVSSLREQFFRELPRLRDALYEQVESRRLLSGSPQSVRGRFLLAAWAFGLIGLALLFFSVVGYTFSFAMFACAGVLLAMASSMPLRTSEGIIEWHRSYALRDGILVLAASGDPSGAPAFDHVFPYAMVLGVADEWALAHKGHAIRPPIWFDGLESDDAIVVAHTLGEFARALGAALRSRPGGTRGDHAADVGGGDEW